VTVSVTLKTTLASTQNRYPLRIALRAFRTVDHVVEANGLGVGFDSKSTSSKTASR
jgi:hypothetical protein